MRIKFKITGLDCANCASDLEKSIKKIEGIKNVTINFITQKMEVECDEERKDEIIKDVKRIIKKEEPDVSIKEI